MSQTPQRLCVKIGKRTWHLVTAHAPEPGPEAVAQLSAEADDPADLLVMCASDEPLLRRWVEWLAQQFGGRWEARRLAAPCPGELAAILANGGLVVGPSPLVSRFRQAMEPEPSAGQEAAPPTKDEHVRRQANLPAPSEVPRFPEEGACDPFGQNAALRAAAWSHVGGFIGRLAATAHRRGLALTLPPPPPGEADPDLRPWRTVVHVEDELTTRPGLPALPARETADEWRPGLAADAEPGLDLLQRCLLVCTALHAGGGTETDWQSAAATLADLGYLLVSRGVAIESLKPLLPLFEVGALAARFHEHQFLHGDLHFGNVAIRPEEAELGKRALTFDLGDACTLDRPPTPRERAQDLAILKLKCTFAQWEAAKLGYRFVARDIAEEVFELI